MKVRLDETLFKARAQENLAMTNEINKLEQVDALVECLDHFVADRKWVDEITRDELLTMVTQSNGDKDALVESVLAKFNTPCIDAKKLKECRERRQNKGLKESMKKRKSLKESDNRDTFTLDTSNTPILDCGLYYTLLGELDPGRYDERFKEFEDCVKECAQPILDELVRKTPNFEVVSVGTYYHPRYYNYETDCLEFTVKYTGDELGTVIEEYSNNQDFIDFLQNYKSYDGFISFYADNKEEFVTQDYIKSVSQIIKYNVTQEDYERANEELYYDVSDCGFYPDDEYDEDETDESLKEKKYDIYVNGKYVASSDRHKRAKDIEDNIRKDGKIKYAGEKAIKTAGVELDELNVDAKDKLKVKRARESKKLKEDYTPSPMSATDFFDSFDFTIYKSTDEDGDPCYKLRDNQGANLGDIEDDTFQSISDAVDRLDMYYEDYIINDLSEIAPELSGLHSGNYEDVFNKIKDMDKTADGHSVRGHKALLYYILHPEQLKDDVRELTESKKLKEGYYGQTLQDFLDDCMDYSIIDNIYIYGNNDVVYEGPIDDIPEDMLDTEFLECDMYTNRKSIVTVNVDSSEEYGAGLYEFLNEFLDDCNCEEVVIYDLAKGEEIFSGYKEDIPEEYLEYAFASYDAPEEMSVNLNDYEGEDDFDESLDDTQNLIDTAKKFAKENDKDVRVTGLANSNECAISTFPEDFNEMVKLFNTKFDVYDEDSDLERFKIKAKSTNENLKEAKDDLQTRATKMMSVKKYYIDMAWKNGKTWKTDPMTLDEIAKSVDADKIGEKQFVDMMSNNIKGRKDAKNLTKAEIVKLYDYMDGKWQGKDVLWSIKGKTNESLKESLEDDMEKLSQVVSAYKDGGKYILELKWRPNRKKAHSDYVDLSQALKKKFGDVNIKCQKQEWRDNNKETRYILEVELKDKEIKEDISPLAKKMGAKLLHPKGYGVKKRKPRYVYEVYYFTTEDCKGDPIFRKFSSRKAQEQWYEAHENDPDKFGMYAFDEATIYENLNESTIPVKDLLIKTDNKYGITLDHAIDDIKRERGYNDPLFGDNGVIDLLMRRYGLEKRDVIRVLNYKFDGKMLDEGCGRKKTSKRAK